jgi:23S rRNA pseudouridine1911/1915/1917 synthase
LPAEERRLQFRVEEAEAGRRLDRFLQERIPDHSRSALQRLIKKGLVLVAGASGKGGRSLKPGETVEITLPAPEPLELEPEDIPVEIVYEDEHLAVINKPAGLVVHPAVGNRTGTLVHALLFHLGDLSGIGGKLRPGIVHRLDKDTSGLMLVAKSDPAHTALVAAIAAREVKREYLALVWGELSEAEGLVDAPLGRDPQERKRIAVLPEKGKPARTHYSRIDSFRGFDYIRLELDTGRTHQIRVHMAHIGHPVFGDPLYGGRRARLRSRKREEQLLDRELLAIMPRQALHAWRLGFTHPITGAEQRFEAPPPEEMRTLLRELGQQSDST